MNIPLPRLDAADAAGWLATAHSLIAAKLTRIMKRELGLA